MTRFKTITVEIQVSSDDVYNTEEACANAIISNINKVVEKQVYKHNTSWGKARNVEAKTSIKSTMSKTVI